MESSLYVYALKNVADADKSELKLVFVFSKRDNLSCRARVLTHAWKSAMHSGRASLQPHSPAVLSLICTELLHSDQTFFF